MARGVIQELKTAPTAPQSWACTSSGKGIAGLGLDDLLVAADQVGQIIRGQLIVELVAVIALDLIELVLEQVMVDAKHHVSIHLDEATIAVAGEAGIAAFGGEAFDGLIVQAEIEDRVHHAGHGDRRTGAHGQEKRVFRITELGARGLLDHCKGPADLAFELTRIGLAVGVIVGADIRCDGEAGRHGEAEPAHLREVRPLTAQKRLHRCIAIGLASTEPVDPFAHQATRRL